MVEIISWNDYGESHYIGPIRADQPNSQGWTSGMDHQGWLKIIKLYSAAFKNGRYPANTDSITLWSRPHPKAATATAPTNPRPSGWEKTDDNLYAFVNVAYPSTIMIWSGNNTATWPNIYPGIAKFSIGNGAGSIGARIIRNGRTSLEYDSGDDFTYTLYVPSISPEYDNGDYLLTNLGHRGITTSITLSDQHEQVSSRNRDTN